MESKKQHCDSLWPLLFSRFRILCFFLVIYHSIFFVFFFFTCLNFKEITLLRHFALHVTFKFLLFSHSAMSDSLWPHGLQHARLLWPSLSPGVCPDSCPLCPWYHPTILLSVAPFSSCPQSFPASGSFPISQLFTSGGQSFRALALVLPMNSQGRFPLRLTGSISLLSKGLSIVFSNTTVCSHQFFGTQPSLWSSSHIHTWLLEKPYIWV